MDQVGFFPNGLWEVKNTGIEINTNSTQTHVILLKLELKRPSTFHVLNTLICIIGLLNVLVFLLSAESEERVSFSIIVLLAMAVFMTIVIDSLPSNSEPNVPRLCYLLSNDLVINALVTVCAILGIRLYHKPDHQEVPQWFKHIV
ncbi:Neuronal acetylcholine receptor subunit alpha-7 [Mizuhopecten yessoensis]|uniref:Neuronal acetylcholine receptor subunit alpha-7 n=1 Tax=Mizuhopecten yessoensis TaxID=6573 RepID=A0A210Q7W5_MIZYE|nr:Neuronal acetylcholine receptor subunit alpha-7 [Mizuhopecten yessoensis]